MINETEAYFEQFGELNYTEIYQENNAYYGLIEFKTVETAQRVLSIGKHSINGYKVEIKVAEPWHQPDHILNVLDNDCLRAILSNLNQLDLTNAANVCDRFNQQAKAEFSTNKLKKLNISQCSYEEAKKVLKTFGSLTQSIDINSFHRFEIEILLMITKSCKVSVLKEIKITDFQFANKLRNDIKVESALTKLERLSLNFCCLKKSAMDFLAVCIELKVLHINNCFFYEDIHLPKFRKLDELRLDGGIGINNNHLNDFIALHPTLTKVSLLQHGFSNICASKTLRTIVQNLPHLVELELNLHTFNRAEFAETLSCLGSLASLKMLKLNLNSQSAAHLNVLTAKAIPIENMRLIKGKIDTETIKIISKMKKLKVLEFCNIDGLNDENLIELAKGLGSQLEKLQMEESTAANLTSIGLKKMLAYTTKLSFLALKSTTIVIDMDDYKSILRTLQKRPEEIGLFLILSGIGDQIEVSENILMKNRDTLRIDEKIEDLGSNNSSPYYYDTDSSIDSSDNDDNDFEYSIDVNTLHV